MLVEVNETAYSPANLKVIGIGGAGGNAVNRMLQSEIRGVEFLVANTDIQALHVSACPNRIQLGAAITGGLGSGGDPEVGRKAAEEDREAIRRHLEGADMIFITCGMGGGTGTGASPVIAEVARELGALTVGIVTRPFNFEGRRRMRQAEEGLEQLRGSVDTLIVIPNQRLLHVVDRRTPLNDALRVADDVLAHAAKGISEIITVPGLINVDFADVRSVMRGMGNALMGMGFGQGEDRAREAAQMAISSPLLEDIAITGAKAILVNFLGGEDMTLAEVEEASNAILEAAGDDANVIFGAVIDPRLTDEIRVTLIATGFGLPRTEQAIAAAGSAADEAERVLAEEFRGKGVAGGTRVPLTAMLRHFSEEDAGDLEGEEADEPIPVAEVPTLIRNRPSMSRPVVRELPARPLPVGPSREASAGARPEPAHAMFDEGIVGSARPIRRAATPEAAPLDATGAHPLVAAAHAATATLPAAASAAPSMAAAVATAPLATMVGANAATAPSGVEIPENVVPLVWKQNLRGREWSPTMSSRWQRVLRRDRLDVPSFLRRRQVD
jgi:cell division protein FtsZ